MRILIMTHPRSGGLSLMSWIAHETKYDVYHEPDFNNLVERDIIFNNDKIVVKTFPHNVSESGIDVIDFINSFDKVICHIRSNITDVAISMVMGSINNTDIKSSWHKTYKIDEKWLEDNKDEIENKISIVKDLINNVERLKDNKCFNTTYESIFETKNDIPKLCEYLEIINPAWLDILDKKRKLRNGEAGMNNIKRRLI
jgi:hypothetical protein